MTYYVVTPMWIRYRDYGQTPPEIVEFDVLKRSIAELFLIRVKTAGRFAP
jgi:hypothetical protein